MKPSRPDIHRLTQQLRSRLVTRFAPSATGYLHLGHVVNAILEDLDWLGFVPDVGRVPLWRQSQEPGVYQEALALLRQKHHVYACACSRKATGGEPYDGRCRDRRLAESSRTGIRVRIDSGCKVFEDLLLERVEQSARDQAGDLLLRDRDGNWTYQFAVSVDDFRQHVTMVIRGADLVASTGRQVRLARMLGRSEPPVFLHHPLVIGPDGAKLSKSQGDTGVRELRASGLTAPEVIGRAAATVGLIEAPRPVHASEVQHCFEIYS